MARIPLQVATRGLDTGPLVQYPQGGGPVGAALQNAGDALQGVALRVKQKQDQQAAFDANILEMEFNGQRSRLEQEAEQNASIDGSGIHDGVYGQIDPNTDQPVKPGSFDQLFDSYMERMPESKRADFAAKREVYRLDGSNRLAGSEYKARQAYEKVQIEKAELDITNAMAAGDPNDIDTFDRFKQQGVDLIENSGLPALEKDVAKTNWLAKADEALFQTKMAKDPEFAGKARAALGLAPPVSNTIPAMAPDQAGRAMQAMSFFTGKGYTKEQAAGIVGNLIQESGLRPSGAVGDNGTAFGIAQWRGERLTRLKRFANANGKHWEDFETQLAFVDMELQSHETDAYRNLKAARTVDEATAAFIGYERPAGWSRGNPRGGHGWSNRVGHAAKIAGVDVPAMPQPQADPSFANIPLDRRLVLANQADAQVGEMQRAAAAQANADYATYKDALELSIVRGETVDENLVASDSILNDGDKATLIRSLRSQNESSIQLSADLAALSGNSLVLDPYDSKHKTRADNLYTETMKRAGVEQAVAVAHGILNQTGILPQPVVNTMRRGLSGTNVQEFVIAAQTAQRVSALNPAALGRRDGGAEVQKTADDFGFMVNTLNLAPEEAARRLIERNSPEKQFQRKALEPAAKEFLKSIQGEDLASQFDDSVMGWRSDPTIGFTPAQEFGIKAEYLAIAEDQFYAVNGDPDLAKNRAVEEMKRLYGVTELTGNRVVMKHPPERYWPKDGSSFGASNSAVRDQYSGLGLGASPKSYREQLEADVSAVDPEADFSTLQLVTTPQTDREVKAGVMPGYAVMWKDKNGVLQTFPGKLWKPDATEMVKTIKARQEEERAKALERGRDADRWTLGGRDRDFSLDNYLDGDPLAPKQYEPSRKPEPGSNIPADLPGGPR